ncbi:hypothetical protein RchiOBHm_Chr6g0255441 [Rosa chinensis]|uniref:Uncharacterized protein n=1 Tax=Rosa chinensis TaxID=74649 RepID=A0A2P6PLY4_ROSCH|nr:hypothetical protein RchiOBHm_Chr6g0255441 [Rosa chinensis]
MWYTVNVIVLAFLKLKAFGAVAVAGVGDEACGAAAPSWSSLH